MAAKNVTEAGMCRHAVRSMALLVLVTALVLVVGSPTMVPYVVLGPTGLPPLVDLGPGETYKGYEGGLYPGGSNVRPADHDAAGRKIAQSIVPLDANGNYDPNGKIVFLPVGISLTNGAWDGYNYTLVNNPLPSPSYTNSSFKVRAEADPAMNPKVALPMISLSADGRNDTRNPDGYYYTEQKAELAAQGLSPQQVQVAWLYPFALTAADSGVPPTPSTFPENAQHDQPLWRASVQALKVVYPNLKIVYMGTKHHPYEDVVAGDPWAHDSAWAVKWVIEEQIKGDPALNYDPAKGAVMAPWIAWGPYFWADDGIPRKYDAFLWTFDDIMQLTDQFGNPIPPPGDYTHPSDKGIYKQATLLLNFVKSDPTSRPWFLKPGAINPLRLGRHVSARVRNQCGINAAVRSVPSLAGASPVDLNQEEDRAMAAHIKQRRSTWYLVDGTIRKSLN